MRARATRAGSRAVARAIITRRSPSAELSPGLQAVGRQWGVVQSLQSGSLTLTLGGSTTPIAGVRYLASYTPTAGDTVVVDHVGSDIMVIGKLA
jgi:hypothetical protein